MFDMSGVPMRKHCPSFLCLELGFKKAYLWGSLTMAIV